jgi:hypothetical protein
MARPIPPVTDQARTVLKHISAVRNLRGLILLLFKKVWQVDMSHVFPSGLVCASWNTAVLSTMLVNTKGPAVT